jgi:hypothetical protein
VGSSVSTSLFFIGQKAFVSHQESYYYGGLLAEQQLLINNLNVLSLFTRTGSDIFNGEDATGDKAGDWGVH